MPRAAMYLWLRLPAGVDDMQYCKRLVAQTGVALAPGRGFGPGGFGFVRVALVQPEGVLQAAAAAMTTVLREFTGGSAPCEGAPAHS